jgi:WXXGXW repeat (2 copies)
MTRANARNASEGSNMKTQTLVSTGFVAAALLSASASALAWTVWPDVDFEWYANVGRMPDATVEITPAPRDGYIWAPGHWETRGAHQGFVSGHWVKDDYRQQVLVYNNGATTYATGPMILRDSQGNIIPTNPSAYPIEPASR